MNQRFKILAVLLIVVLLGISARAIVSLWNLSGPQIGHSGEQTPLPEDSDPPLSEEDQWAVLEDPQAPGPERLQAAAAISKLGSSAAARLTQDLKSPEPSVRRYAAMALKDLRPGTVAAVPRLVELMADPDELTASAAMQAAGAIGSRDEAVIAALKAALASDSAAIRKTAGSTLASLKPSPVQLLVDNLDHPDAMVAKAMEAGLWEAASRQSAEVIHALRPRMEQRADKPSYDPFWRLVFSIREATRAQFLDVARKHPSVLVRARIASILIAKPPAQTFSPTAQPPPDIDAVEFLPTFREAILNGSETRVSEYCEVLEHRVGKPAVPLLEELVQSANPAVQLHAAIALAEFAPSESLVPILITGLSDTQPSHVRFWSATKLGRLGRMSAPAIPILEKMTSDPDKDVAETARFWLPQIRQRPARTAD